MNEGWEELAVQVVLQAVDDIETGLRYKDRHFDKPKSEYFKNSVMQNASDAEIFLLSDYFHLFMPNTDGQKIIDYVKQNYSEGKDSIAYEYKLHEKQKKRHKKTDL